jgi:hypothetical protein
LLQSLCTTTFINYSPICLQGCLSFQSSFLNISLHWLMIRLKFGLWLCLDLLPWLQIKWISWDMTFFWVNCPITWELWICKRWTRNDFLNLNQSFRNLLLISIIRLF